MPFVHGDLRRMLFADFSDVGGAYNGLNWRIIQSADSLDLLSQLISRHEYAHNLLNNSTAFGAFLIGYANLHYIQPAAGERYGQTLSLLIERCDVAHESYATWDSLQYYNNAHNDYSMLTRFSLPEIYQDYFWKAENMYKAIPSSYLKGLVHIAVMRWCFQSIAIAEAAVANFDTCWIPRVRNREFPNSRFKYLKEHIPAEFFRDVIAEFIEENKNSMAYPFMKAEMADDHTSPIPQDGVLDSFDGILYNKFADYLEASGPYSSTPTFRNDDHIFVFHRLFDRIYDRYPSDKFKHVVTINANPFDQWRTEMLHNEQEELHITHNPIKCYVILPENLNELQSQFFKDQSVDYTVLIHCRHSGVLLTQYEFVRPEDRELLHDHAGGLVFLRELFFNDDGQFVLLVPFLNPDALVAFLKMVPEDGDVCPMTSVSALADSDFTDKWDILFLDDTVNYILNDVSLLFLLEEYLPERFDVSYAQYNFQIENKTYITLIFSSMSEHQIETMVITPGSALFVNEAKRYIQSRFLHYKPNLELTPLQSAHVELLIGSIFTQEHFWHLRTSLCIETLNQKKDYSSGTEST